MIKKGMLLKYYRLSRKQYLIDKMKRAGMAGRNFALDMKKYMTTEEVESIFENLGKTEWGKKKLKKLKKVV
jgi:hypothetical protein